MARLLAMAAVAVLFLSASATEGQVSCSTDRYRIGAVKVSLLDRDVLPWEMDDLMGLAHTEANGTFVIHGCGSDLGWWNQPDPYIHIDHRCPETGHNVAITHRHTIVFLNRTFLPTEYILEEVIKLDENQVEKIYSAVVS